MLKLLVKLLLAFILAAFFSSSAIAGGSFTFKWGQDQAPKKHQAKHKNGGAPDHAPAHGYRAKHQYRYYPSQQVYHDSDRGLYFYLKGDNWEAGASLPSHLKAALGESVTFELDIDNPYLQNSEHIKKYPPKKSKGKKNKKWAKKKK